MKSIAYYYQLVKEWYSDVPFLTKLFISLRWYTTPYDKIIEYIENKSKILDIGCSHGLFEAILLSKKPQCEILGIDPSTEKIQIAQELKSTLLNASFQKGYLHDIKPEKKYDYITILDVLYLLPDIDKITLLHDASNYLKPGGQIIVNTIEKENTFSYFLSYIQEVLALFILRFTHTSHTSIHFFSRQEFLELLDSTDYTITKESYCSTGFHTYRIYSLRHK